MEVRGNVRCLGPQRAPAENQTGKICGQVMLDSGAHGVGNEAGGSRGVRESPGNPKMTLGVPERGERFPCGHNLEIHPKSSRPNNDMFRLGCRVSHRRRGVGPVLVMRAVVFDVGDRQRQPWKPENSKSSKRIFLSSKGIFFSKRFWPASIDGVPTLISGQKWAE